MLLRELFPAFMYQNSTDNPTYGLQLLIRVSIVDEYLSHAIGGGGLYGAGLPIGSWPTSSAFVG